MKRFVVDTAVQIMQSHVELYLGLGIQGSSGIVLAHSLVRGE